MRAPTELATGAIDSCGFQIDLQLLSEQLQRYLLVTTLFYAAFTAVFYVGIPIQIVYEALGTSKESEALMETYNTYSGYIMALVEVLVAMYMDHFVPVLEVFVHNALFFLGRDASGEPKSTSCRRLHSVLLLLLPVVLSLTNSSIKSLQAVQFTTGIRRIMTIEDMKKEQPMLELIKRNTPSTFTEPADPTTASDTILKNAVRQRATPFTFDTQSPCGQAVEGEDFTTLGSDWKLNAHEIGATSVVYGFIPREWNSEAMTTAPNRTSTYSVNYREAIEAVHANTSLPAPRGTLVIQTAYEMLVQAKMVIERAFGNSAIGSYNCSLSDGLGDRVSSSSVPSSEPPLANATASSSSDDGNVFVDDSLNQWTYDKNGTRQCEGGVSAMLNMADYYTRAAFRAEDLVRDAAAIIRVTIPDMAVDETQITLDTYDVTPQITLETMQIDLVLRQDVIYGNQTLCSVGNASCEPTYSFAPFQNTFCGSSNCAFLDTSGTFPVQPEIGVLPYFTNCTLARKRVHYSADFRGYYPDECTRAKNASFLYGYGSYMSGHEYGSSGYLNASYIVAPRRRISFTFAKVVWATVDLAEAYDATCALGDEGQQGNCVGLAYQLQPSGRFLFAGKAALPTQQLRNTDYRSPIPLVQLNSPTVYIETTSGGRLATIERLAPEHFTNTVWPVNAIYGNSSLGGSKCSMLMDSYFQHVNENHYFLEQPLQAMYTAFFYFLMENAAVTELSAAALSTNATTSNTPSSMSDRLGNAKLKGDLQLRSIRVSIPSDSFFTTLAGCVGIFLTTMLVLVVPARRVKYFAAGTTKAEQFVAMRKDADYPDDVHNKLLRFPATRGSVRFSDLEIDAVILVQRASLLALASEVSKSIDIKVQEEPPRSTTEPSDPGSSQDTISEDIP